MKLLVCDFETYWGKDYSLKAKGYFTEKYIRDPQFKVHGCGVKVGDNKTVWVTASKLPALFAR